MRTSWAVGFLPVFVSLLCPDILLENGLENLAKH